MEGAPDLRLFLQPSRRLAAVLLALHAGPLLLFPGVDLSPWALAPLGLCLVGSAAYCLRRHALLTDPRAVVELGWTSRSGWWLVTRAGVWVSASALPPAFVSPALVVLRLRGEGDTRQWPVILVPDMADAQALRRLRVHLRWLAWEAPSPEGQGDGARPPGRAPPGPPPGRT